MTRFFVFFLYKLSTGLATGISSVCRMPKTLPGTAVSS